MPEFGDTILPVGGGGDSDWALLRGRDVSVPSPIAIESFATYDSANDTLVTTGSSTSGEIHRFTAGMVVTITTNLGDTNYNGTHTVLASGLTDYSFAIDQAYVATSASLVRVYGPPAAEITDDALFVTDTAGDGDLSGTKHVTALTMKGYMGGGSDITIEDEGSALATAATTLDFVGAGVAATGSGAEKTITITDTQPHTLIDDDNFATGVSATSVASSSSIKAYVDANSGSTSVVDDSTSNTDFPIVFHDESNGLLDDTSVFVYRPGAETLTVPHFTAFPQLIDYTGGASTTGVYVNLDRTGDVSGGGTDWNRAINLQMDVTGASNASVGNTLIKGILNADDPANNAKIITNKGINLAISKGDISYGLSLYLTNQIESYGIHIDNVDGQIDYKSVSSANAGDYFTMATTAAGATTLATVDATVGATGHLTLDVDGDIILKPAGGDVVFHDGTSDIFKFDTANPTLYIYDDLDTDGVRDFFSIAVGEDGSTTFNTYDDSGGNGANLHMTIGGTVDIDSTAGAITLDSGGAINLEPGFGSAILLDGTISIDAGVVTGATSISSAAMAVTNNGTYMIQQHDGGEPGNVWTASWYATTLTASRNIGLPDASGVIALVDNYEYEYIVCNYSAGLSANLLYFPLCGYLYEQTSLGSTNSEYVAYVVPHDGTFHKLFWRPYNAQASGNMTITFNRGGDGDTYADTLVFRSRFTASILSNRTYENEIGVTTSGDTSYTDNSFSAGDIISIGFDPRSAPGDVKCTVVLKYDMRT